MVWLQLCSTFTSEGMKNADVRKDAGEEEATTVEVWHVEDMSITEQLMS